MPPDSATASAASGHSNSPAPSPRPHLPAPPHPCHRAATGPPRHDAPPDPTPLPIAPREKSDSGRRPAFLGTPIAFRAPARGRSFGIGLCPAVTAAAPVTAPLPLPPQRPRGPGAAFRDPRPEVAGSTSRAPAGCPTTPFGSAHPASYPPTPTPGPTTHRI